MSHTTPLLFVIAAFVLAPCIAVGQNAPGATFDVASIRPAVPLQQQIASGQLRVGSTITDARVDLRSASLAEMIVIAYGIKPFQLDGPDWIRSERYDMQATLPPGGNKAQVPEMLQTLLAERFKLQIRRDRREHPVYALVVGSDGHKLIASPPPAPTPDVPPPGGRTVEVGGQQVQVGADGRMLSALRADGASMRVIRSDSGGMQMMLSHITLASFADMLTAFVDRPVVDATGLTGGYDIAFDLQQEDLLTAARVAAQSAGVTLPILMPPAAQPGQAADPAGSSVFSSVQKLGLRLDARRMPVDVIIVQAADKLPIAN